MANIKLNTGKRKGDLTGKYRSSAKLAYIRPSLSIFGSVREITGAGTGGNADAAMTMMA